MRRRVMVAMVALVMVLTSVLGVALQTQPASAKAKKSKTKSVYVLVSNKYDGGWGKCTFKKKYNKKGLKTYKSPV